MTSGARYILRFLDCKVLAILINQQFTFCAVRPPQLSGRVDFRYLFDYPEKSLIPITDEFLTTYALIDIPLNHSERHF